MDQLREDKQKYKDKCKEYMHAHEQNKSGRYSPDRTRSPPRDNNNDATPEKLHALLGEVNKQIDEGNTSHII